MSQYTPQIRVHMQMLCKWCFSYLAACANMSELFTGLNMRSHAPRKDVIKAIAANALRALPTVEIACCHFNCLIKLLPNLLTRSVQYVFRELSRRTESKKAFCESVCVRA
jgi:hypothetical protein